jgi:uncharacterized protein (DUF2236 family)
LRLGWVLLSILVLGALLEDLRVEYAKLKTARKQRAEDWAAFERVWERLLAEVKEENRVRVVVRSGAATLDRSLN